MNTIKLSKKFDELLELNEMKSIFKSKAELVGFCVWYVIHILRSDPFHNGKTRSQVLCDIQGKSINKMMLDILGKYHNWLRNS